MNALLITVLAVLLSLAALAAFVSGRRVIRDDGRLRLLEMMQRRGAALPEPLSEPAVRNQAHALRVCVTCPNKDLCDEWLRGSRTGDSYAFCPNTHYIEQLRQGRLAFNRV